MTEPMSKQEAYRLDLYCFNVPPVGHNLWTDQDWISFIDSNGGWLCPVK